MAGPSGQRGGVSRRVLWVVGYAGTERNLAPTLRAHCRLPVGGVCWHHRVHVLPGNARTLRKRMAQGVCFRARQIKSDAIPSLASEMREGRLSEVPCAPQKGSSPRFQMSPTRRKSSCPLFGDKHSSKTCLSVISFHEKLPGFEDELTSFLRNQCNGAHL